MAKSFKLKQFDTILSNTSDEYKYLESKETLPVIALQDGVLFPNNSLPLGCLEEHLRASDIRAAERGSLKVGILSKTVADDGSVHFASVGTEAVVANLLKLPDGRTGAVVKSTRRFIVDEVQKRRFGLVARVTFIQDQSFRKTTRTIAMTKALKGGVVKVLSASSGISDETKATLTFSEDPIILCNMVAPHLSLNYEEKIDLLSDFNISSRVKKILKLISRELQLLKLSEQINEEVSGDLHESHRRYFLREQIRAIKRELGELDGLYQEVEEIEEEVEKLKLPKIIREAVDEELERMNIMGPGSPEYIISHSYVTLMKELPWKESHTKSPSLQVAREILNKGHFGLEKVKEKVLDYLAVLQHKNKISGQIILLNGPPGVGKTSLAQSIAQTLDRSFARVALGGVKDEAEIRGHRRTYMGAMPGKIIQAIKQSKSRDAVILLDEIDKVGGEPQGSVEAALLEVLDPEQNKSFVDHYLAVPFDLSKIIFVATSNSIDRIAGPLLDRMEILEIPSYTRLEKLQIAKRHIIPKIRKELSLKANQFKIDDPMILDLIEQYTREAGVRQLQREILTLGRKIIKEIVEKKSRAITHLSKKSVPRYLGPPKFMPEPTDAILIPGVSIGLAYTDFGGEILYVEVKKTPIASGGPRLHLTGSLGKVMSESAYAALTYLTSAADSIGLDSDKILNSALHIHFPDGGTPKDGPSAGLAILCAMTSLFLDKSIPIELTMTGEITLRGQILAVGGIKEKILAAHRYGKKRVLIPDSNRNDLEDIPHEVLDELEIVAVSTMDEALTYAELVPWRLKSQVSVRRSSLPKKPAVVHRI